MIERRSAKKLGLVDDGTEDSGAWHQSGRVPSVAEWVADNAYRYDLTTTRSDSGEGGWVDYEVASETGIAQMYEDMIAAGVGLSAPARTPPE